MTALVRLLSRLLLAALALARVARSMGARIDALPRPSGTSQPDSREVPTARSEPFRRALAEGRASTEPAHRAQTGHRLATGSGRAGRHQRGGVARSVDRDIGLVGGLLLLGGVAGYALVAFLGGGAPGNVPLAAGVATATASPTLVPSGPATPPLTGDGTATPSVAAVTPSPSEPPPPVAAPMTPTTRLLATLDRSGAPLVELSWAGPPGARFEVGLAALPDGEWQSVQVEGPDETAARLSVVADRAYRARVRAVTDSGTSAWVESVGFRLTAIDDAQPAVVYDGRWTTAGHPLYRERDASFSRVAGATATLRFVGSSICWRGPTGPARGTASVFVDGQRQAGVDTRARTFQARRVLFVENWAVASEHRLQIVLGGAGSVAVDAFFVLEAAE